MNDSKKKLGLNNGWILCPSKSFPGKFYYFNVLNGEAAWSLNEADNKDLRKDTGIHEIADKSHDYPEPTTLPDETTITTHQTSTNTNVNKPDFSRNITCTQLLPTFGQAAFPKYITNDHVMPNIVWATVPLPMFCENKRPMYDKVTQISEFERDLFMQASDIPLCKRFKNYEKPCLSFDKRNKIVRKPTAKFETSTPKNTFLECSEAKNCFLKAKPLIQEPILKFNTMLPNQKIPEIMKSNEKPILSFNNKVQSTNFYTDPKHVIMSNKKPTLNFANKVESTITSMAGSKHVINNAKPILTLGNNVENAPSSDEKDKVLENLDSSDLRFLLLAKRKSVDTTADTAVERKKPKPSEIKTLTLKKKVTFDLNNETDEDIIMSSDETTQDEFIPLTPTHTIPVDTPKSPILHQKDKTLSAKDTEVTPHFQTGVPTDKNKTWYIVVDTDVLLLDYEFIDKLVLSDPKCRLVIPKAVAKDIEALCIGDCHGQQRIINARQLTRKLATPPPHYIVEPSSTNNNDIVVTTESILNCCLKAVNKNCYVVLITNDPHLQMRATLLNIPSYKLNEIKYGVNIKPNMTTDQRTKNNTEKTNNSSLYKHLIKPEITSEIKKNITTNDDRKSLTFNSNLFSDFSTLNTVKKQLFLNSSNETENCDKLINITKPKCMKHVENKSKYDSDSSTSSDISREVQNLNIKDQNILKTVNVNRNPFLPNKVNEFVNYEKRILNSNAVFNFEKTIPNSKREMVFEKPVNNTEKVFCSIPTTNLKPFQFQDSKLKSNSENSKKSIENKMKNSFHEPYGANKILNSSQTRIEKMFSTINNNSTSEVHPENQNTKTKDSTGLFKIPAPFKSRTRNTSVHVESTTANDKIGTPIVNIDCIDSSLKRFCVKSKVMRGKLRTRMDEWVCSFMQILEDVLINLLLKNTVCMKNTVAPLSLRDILNCVKMLYDSQTKIRDIVNRLSKLLERCIICIQGKFKILAGPDDFMTMFGCGVLLVLALKNILPHSEELKEAELRLSNLQYNIESNARELDPELVKSPSVSRTDVLSKDEEVRPQFLKKTSYVIDYLKKHFEEWASYKDDPEDEQYHQILNHPVGNVLRTLGKNLNKLKIDRKKNMSLSKDTIEKDPADQGKDGPNFIRLLENNQLIKPNDKENENFTKINEIITNLEDDVAKLMEPYGNIDQDPDNKLKDTEEFNYTTHENTFVNNEEIDGPKMIRNIKLIDEFEEKIKQKEPLDLDQLDYSEIYEPSVAENLEFDVFSEKKNDSDEKNKNNNVENIDNNFGLSNTTIFLEDFYLSPSQSCDSKTNNNKATEDSKNSNDETNNITSKYFDSASNNSVANSKNNNCGYESATYTENFESNNNSCYENDISETNNNDSGTHINISETHNISANQIQNSISRDNFTKTAQIIRDDSTNDSGFENDSIYAHSTIKIFLNELSISFKVIYNFVTKFIEEISEKGLSETRKDIVHSQATKSLEEMIAIILLLQSIIKREAPDDTILKTLLRKAGVEATTDKRITRYRQIVIKCLEQAQILESALKIIVSTTIGDFEALSTNAETINSRIRYFNIFEQN